MADNSFRSSATLTPKSSPLRTLASNSCLNCFRCSATLGFVTEFWAVNEFDRSIDYDTANFSASFGMNVGVGLFTGGASNLRYARAAGKAFNGASFAADTYRAGAQIYNDGGLTTGNALQSVLTATGVGDAVPVGSIARRLGFDASTGRLGELFADQRIGVNAPKDVVPDVRTGAGYGVNDPPVRIQGEWSDNDLKAALLGHPPRGLDSPDLHHAGQMPGSAVHEVIPSQHRGNKALHPNKRNQGVTAEMRKADRELHWWYRAQEEGARQRLPGWIYDD